MAKMDFNGRKWSEMVEWAEYCLATVRLHSGRAASLLEEEDMTRHRSGAPPAKTARCDFTNGVRGRLETRPNKCPCHRALCESHTVRLAASGAEQGGAAGAHWVYSVRLIPAGRNMP